MTCTSWCVNGFGWCPGPDADAPEPSEAWGGECSDCCLWPELEATMGRYGWNQDYLTAGGASA